MQITRTTIVLQLFDFKVEFHNYHNDFIIVQMHLFTGTVRSIFIQHRTCNEGQGDKIMKVKSVFKFPTLLRLMLIGSITLGENPNFVNEIFRNTVLAFYFSAE